MASTRLIDNYIDAHDEEWKPAELGALNAAREGRTHVALLLALLNIGLKLESISDQLRKLEYIADGLQDP